MAAACVHLRAGRGRPALRLLALGLEKLADAPRDVRGLPAADLAARARALAAELAADGSRIDPALYFSPPPGPGTG